MFKRKGDLTKHLATVHLKEKRFKCHHCLKVIIWSKYVKLYRLLKISELVHHDMNCTFY